MDSYAREQSHRVRKWYRGKRSTLEKNQFLPSSGKIHKKANVLKKGKARKIEY